MPEKIWIKVLQTTVSKRELVHSITDFSFYFSSKQKKTHPGFCQKLMSANYQMCSTQIWNCDIVYHGNTSCFFQKCITKSWHIGSLNWRNWRINLCVFRPSSLLKLLLPFAPVYDSIHTRFSVLFNACFTTETFTTFITAVYLWIHASAFVC